MSSNAKADGKFQIRRQGRRLGPFDRTQIDRMIARQQLGVKDEISPTGNNQWQRIDQWQLDEQASDDSKPKVDEAVSKEASPPNVDGVSNPALASLKTGDAAIGEWYIASDGNRQGPIDEHTLGRWISERRIDAETLVWRSGMEVWKPARDVLPAALVLPTTTAALTPSSNHASSPAVTAPDDGGYALKDLRSRRVFWVLIVCILTYIFAAELFATGLFQIYTAVAIRRGDSGGMVALWAVGLLVFASLLLMMAIGMTKLLTEIGRVGRAEDPVAVARHEHRVWLFAGLSAAFIIAIQIVVAIFFLITIAQAT